MELHMIVGSLKKGIRLDGYVDNNLLEFANIKPRHDALVAEMIIRGMNHKSPIPAISNSLIASQTPYVRESAVDRELSLQDLVSRCRKCSSRLSKEKQDEE